MGCTAGVSIADDGAAPICRAARIYSSWSHDRTIYPTRLYNHRGFSDAWISLIGLVALLAILIPRKANRRFVQQKRLIVHDSVKDATLRLAQRKKTN
jgi:hypothetical protein